MRWGHCDAICAEYKHSTPFETKRSHSWPRDGVNLRVQTDPDGWQNRTTTGYPHKKKRPDRDNGRKSSPFSSLPLFSLSSLSFSLSFSLTSPYFSHGNASHTVYSMLAHVHVITICISCVYYIPVYDMCSSFYISLNSPSDNIIDTQDSVLNELTFPLYLLRDSTFQRLILGYVHEWYTV